MTRERSSWAARLASVLTRDLPLVLIWSCIALLPFGRSVELPVLIMAVWSLGLLWVHRGRFLQEGGARLLTVVFVVVWASAIFSSFDAVNPERTIRTMLALPRLYLAGLFVIYVLSDPEAWARFLRGSAWILLFWLGDALLQAVVGFNVLGYERPTRVNGLFGETIKLGFVLPMYLPLLFEHAVRCWGRWRQAGVLALAALVILLAGSRAGWITFALAVAFYVVRVARASRWSPLMLGGGLAAGAIILFGVTYFTFPDFQRRVDVTLLVFSGERAAVDTAVSLRLPIWRTAAHMIAAHPVNGVGARGFRYAYPAHAGPDDPFYDPATGGAALHAHQLVLDVLAETGTVGLACLLFGLVWLARAWKRADPAARRHGFSAGVALFVTVFPLNTHMAFYSSFWSQVLWFLIALYCAGLAVRVRHPAR